LKSVFERNRRRKSQERPNKILPEEPTPLSFR
jgi:hypothetical protein